MKVTLDYASLYAPIYTAVLFLEGTAEQLRALLDTICDAIRRCNNCGSIMPADTHICPRCNWDNIRNEEAK